MKGACIGFMLVAGTITSVAADQRTDCRDSWKTDHEHFLKCVAAGVYDPCDDAGGSWGKAQCAYAYTEIAERKIVTVETNIRARLARGAKQRSALAAFDHAEKEWHTYRESYCTFTNTAEQLPEFDVAAGTDWDSSFCRRRLTEQHAGELEFILRMEREK